MKWLFVPAFVLIFTSIVFPQGCSDAGFCTMGAMKPDQPFNKKIDLKLRSMEVSFYRGTTPVTAVIYVATADLNFGINDRTFFQVKLPYQGAHGNLGSTSGLGDISLCFTRTVRSTEKFDINFSFGGKIRSNDSDLTSNKSEFKGKPLPMYYQTSLGTYDLIGGVSLISPKWLIATGIQHPLNENDNQFSWGPWLGVYPDPNYIRKYAAAINLKRGTDVMVRVERNFRFSRVNFTVGLLPIYRISRDEVLDPTTMERTKPPDAHGLAMSAIFTTGYSFNVRSGVKLLFGQKITQRKINPDGLTREYVTTISYYYRF